MSTWLVNSKMDPRLAARIVASVKGRRRTVLERSSKRAVLVARFGVIAALVGLAAYAFWVRRATKLELEQLRAAVTREWDGYSRELASDGDRFLRHVERLLLGLAGDYERDYVDGELTHDTILTSTLNRPSVYVRIPIGAAMSHESVAAAAAQSGMDSLLLCLLDPPRPASERAFLPKARAALAGGATLQLLTSNADRLHDAELGMSYLTQAWRERIVRAEDTASITRLQRELRKAPIASAKKLLRAELLVAVLDEANDSGGVTELDGEHAHSVRVAIWDLARDKLLLRARRQVDPSWITPNRRSQYARELDSCKLAIAVHDLVAGTGTEP